MNPELSIVGAAMADPRIALASNVRPRHFDNQLLGECWRVIAAHADQGPVSPLLIITRLGISGQRAHDLSAALVGAFSASHPGDAEIHAATIREASERRDMGALAARVAQMVQGGAPVEQIRQAAGSLIADDSDADTLAASVMTANEFVDQELPDEQWIIPDTLASGDRMILTGAEGAGKSLLCRQIAMCVAAGCHPFNRRPMPPSRVLVVDAENPQRIMMSKFRAIRDALRVGGFETEDRIMIHRAPGGMDLTTPQGRMVLRSLCRMVGPELLVIGPIYKLFTKTSESDEAPASQVTHMLDELRAEYDCAVIAEHHSPMGSGGERLLRPIGTGLWMKWPEFGFGIAPAEGTRLEDRQMVFRPWRGSRDERAWPERLQGSGSAPGRLPWLDPDDLGRAWSRGLSAVP